MKCAGRAVTRTWRQVLCTVLVCEAISYAENGAAGQDIFHIDPALTRAEFEVAHFWVTRLHGTFGQAHGTIVLDGQGRTGSIDFTVDADSVDTGWSVRDDFIRGEHMFDAPHFPKVRFHSTQLAFDETRLTGASGELTLHDVTRPAAVRVERMECAPDNRGGERCGVAVISSIKRSDFGLSFGLPFVGDDIDLSFHLVAHRVSP